MYGDNRGLVILCDNQEKGMSLYVAIMNLYFLLWLKLYDAKPLKFTQTSHTISVSDVNCKENCNRAKPTSQ